MYEDFATTQMLEHGDVAIDVLDFNGHMAICVQHGPILITKDQAMAFFGLVDPNAYHINRSLEQVRTGQAKERTLIDPEA